jgi:hypothetical protein
MMKESSSRRRALIQSATIGLLLLFAIVTSASAEPTFRQVPLGAALQIFATNQAAEAFNCHAQWFVDGDEFGVRQKKPMDAYFFVRAHAENELVLTGGVPALTNAQAELASISCGVPSHTIREADRGAQPQGSYKASCNNCTVVDGKLKCGNCNTGTSCNLFNQSCAKPSEIEFRKCENNSVHNDHGNLTCDSAVGGTVPSNNYLGKWVDALDARELPAGLVPEGSPFRYPVPLRCGCVHLQHNGRAPNGHTVTLINECSNFVVLFSEKDTSPRTSIQPGDETLPASGRQFGVTPLGRGNSVTFNVEQGAFDFHMPLVCSEGGQPEPNEPLFTID